MIEIDMKLPSCCDECFALDFYNGYPHCIISMKSESNDFDICSKRMPSCPMKENEPMVLTLDEAAAAHEVWVEAWLSVPKKYVIMVTSLYLTDDCKNFELELLGTDKKAFMLAEAYGHTWRCWSARPTDEQREAVKWDD